MVKTFALLSLAIPALVGCGVNITDTFNYTTGGNTAVAATEEEDTTEPLTESTLTAYDGVDGQAFATSVAVSGNWMVVGSFADATAGANAGAIYIYQYDGTNWNFFQKITSPVGAGKQFGITVAIEDTHIAVGAPCWCAGNSYIVFYEYNGITWAYNSQFANTNGYSVFGYSLDIENDRAISGAHAYGGSDNGRAYFYDWNGSLWVSNTDLVPADNDTWDQFGRSVSMSGDYAAIGARWDEDVTAGSIGGAGSVYIYKNVAGVWGQVAKIDASDAVSDDYFGSHVKMYSDYIFVGAVDESTMGSDAGAVYVFKKGSGDTWTEEQKILAGDGGADHSFGSRISRSGDIMLISASNHTELGADTGKVYYFKYDGTSWNEYMRFLPGSVLAGDQFGENVNITDDYYIIGANGHATNGVDEIGTLFFFER